ncbi:MULTISPECIES: ATP-binding protein [unclassified Methylophaga]|jgi:nitrogen fixation/metabolism regulation signal transduction histidine kinase|uniref:sensor histidine kinase n=1 Tax=unclassified Methylophaga TaxID=2629249 RepID=UPI000C973230|nr:MULTISPECIES: ATP-binding protein [unclassified Methylophaga]MAK68097.1 two-component sensor histidine kinase [Methylophaga sp.]MAY17882.1 two-component sensor histidine kinase [Methylophaga sp.]MBN46911.1 two-component sensor histidine kinase [Methylophaga sp.]HCD03944.1 two-component sensor histidine kinase [Methylophaga sp.]|tara:strand:+ start:6427 stop:8586 length:2160 start_codon:yes stop_codon:yes gene_type:complete
MAFQLIRGLSSGTAPYFSLALLLLVLAYLLSAATQDTSRLSDLFLYIFGLGLVCLLLLAGILARGLYRLYRDFKRKAPGSRLTLKLVSLFVLLIVGSTSIVYGFSVHFLQRGINSWFDVKVEQALEDSLELSRSAFGIRMRTLLRQTRMMAGVLSELPDTRLTNSLRELVQLSGALEISIWNMSGQLVVSSIENPAIFLPQGPDESIVRRLQQGEDYIGLDPAANDELELRAAVMLPRKSILAEERFLHVAFPVNEHLSSLGKNVQDAYTDYKELSYLRKPLVTIFTLTLSLIVFLTMLASIWFAVWISRRMVQPLQELAAGTQAVASGNYNMQLTASGHDEIGFLVRSFNQMTQRLTQARNASDRSHRLLEQQTSYLTTVLGSLSSGVITIDNDLYLRTANVASSKILGVNLQQRLESSLDTLGKINDNLHSFSLLIQNYTFKSVAWQQQIELQQTKGRQTLMCHGTPLPADTGWVIVFDDITTLLQAQRNAAWGEVARRLAHEIKNPLTPIQLSAERLQHKYASLVPPDQTETLQKLTDTIVQQVEAMKDMVNEFSDYARSPGLQLEKVSIGELLREVLTLYQSHSNHQFTLLNSPTEIPIRLDKNRMRQVFHNLLKNAIEASEEADKAVDIVISYHVIIQQHMPWLEITINDQGPGFPQEMIDKLFEPYATTKIKGTGLGLAIVKKIIEEHGGDVWAENLNPEGAGIIIRLPLEED